MSRPENAGGCVLHREKGFDIKLFEDFLFFILNLVPGELKTFVSTGNVLLHSVTPWSWSLYIYIYIYVIYINDQ